MRDEQERAAEHLCNRLRRLDDIWYRRWPRWTNDDYIAVKFLLDSVEQNRNLTPLAGQFKRDVDNVTY